MRHLHQKSRKYTPPLHHPADRRPAAKWFVENRYSHRSLDRVFQDKKILAPLEWCAPSIRNGSVHPCCMLHPYTRWWRVVEGDSECGATKCLVQYSLVIHLLDSSLPQKGATSFSRTSYSWVCCQYVFNIVLHGRNYVDGASSNYGLKPQNGNSLQKKWWTFGSFLENARNAGTSRGVAGRQSRWGQKWSLQISKIPKSATRNTKTTKEIRTKQNKIKIH